MTVQTSTNPRPGGRSERLLRWIMRLIDRVGPHGTAALITSLVWIITNIVVEIGYRVDDITFTERPAIGAMPWVMPILVGYPVIFALVRIIERLGHVEADLRSSETKYRNLLEGSLQGVCVHRELVPVFATQTFAEMFGYDSVDEIMEKGSIRFSVTDHGRGIPVEFRDRIFDKFTQADQGEQRQSGTGLGLSICKLLVERHNGKIGFSSEVDRGTTFYFDLPEHHEEERFRSTSEPFSSATA